jgi:hypothetical protein
MDKITNRIIRVFKLDANIFEEVEADKEAFQQSMLIVALSGLAAGIGTIRTGLSGLLLVTIFAIAGWFFWSFLVYLIGAKLLQAPGTEADYGQLLRTIGFASAPGLIRVLGIIPLLDMIVFPVASIWTIIAMVIAVRQALDYESTMRAVLVCVVAYAVQFLLFWILWNSI